MGMTTPTTRHAIGSREDWLSARLALLDAEKELTRRSDELARRRQELPWVRVEKDYVFDTDDGPASLRDLFGGRSQLIVYHFMYAPSWTEGCPSCSSIADGFDGIRIHLQNHDVAFTAVSRASLAQLQASPTDGLDATSDAYVDAAESPGMSAFVQEDGEVYHTYSAYSRGVDALWGMYQWLDRAPKGRNDGEGMWFRRHDEYPSA